MPQQSLDDLRRLVGEDPAFQRRIWIMQRSGWAAMAVLVLGALAGGLGDGPLTDREARSDDGALRVRHDAVARQDSDMRWRIDLPPGAPAVTISTDELDAIDVVSIHPSPERQARTAPALTLWFAGGSSQAVLTVNPRRPGLLAVTASAGGAAVAFRTLVLP
jgi:hypothetical protein